MTTFADLLPQLALSGDSRHFVRGAPRVALEP